MIITSRAVELEIADQLDGDGEVKISLTGDDGDSVLTYLTQDQIKQLFTHLLVNFIL
jgi:hypothetical protein